VTRRRRLRRRAPAAEALGGYAEVQPMVFCGLFPTEADRFPDLREALGKLQLNDAALVYEPEVRAAPRAQACLPTHRRACAAPGKAWKQGMVWAACSPRGGAAGRSVLGACECPPVGAAQPFAGRPAEGPGRG